MKICNKEKFQQIASNHIKYFMEFYQDYNKKPYSFLVNDATFSSDNPLRFRKNL